MVCVGAQAAAAARPTPAGRRLPSTTSPLLLYLPIIRPGHCYGRLKLFRSSRRGSRRWSFVSIAARSWMNLDSCGANVDCRVCGNTVDATVFEGIGLAIRRSCREDCGARYIY